MRRSGITRREAIAGTGCLILGLSSSCTSAADPTGDRKVRPGARTTPTPPVDIAKAIPDLKPFARTTVRLHPRRGTDADDGSRIGGRFLWPANEAWPECGEHRCALVTALQLRKEDVPEVRFRGDSDLLQVLWCPNDHEPEFGPRPQVFWRKRTDVTTLKSPSKAGRFNPEYVAQPCVMSPERVIEYPDILELSEDLKRKIDRSDELKMVAIPDPPDRWWDTPKTARAVYQCWLSTAHGTKVGGYPDWIQDPEYPSCSCGGTMEHVVTFASSEFDAISWGRWLPLDERGVLTARYEMRTAVQAAAGWMFGDAGSLYLFLCRRCEPW